MQQNAQLHLPRPQPSGPEVSSVIALWQFVGFRFVLRMRGSIWGIPEATFTCSEMSAFATPAALDQEYWHIRNLLVSWNFSFCPWLFLYKEEWKPVQSKPATSLCKKHVKNHVLFPRGRKTYLCLQKRSQTEGKRRFQQDTWTLVEPFFRIFNSLGRYLWRKNIKQTSRLFGFFSPSPAHAKMIHCTKRRIYASPLSLPFSSMAENTFVLLRDQPEQSKKARAAPHPLFGLG